MKTAVQDRDIRDTPRVVSLSVPGHGGTCPGHVPMSRYVPNVPAHRSASFAKTLAARYRAGRTLRQIGAEVGKSHFAIWWHLRKLPGHRDMVTRILVKRLHDAERRYALTRAREDRRRLKHAAAMIRRNRPEILKQLTDSARPKACSGCGRAVAAKQIANLWTWDCGYCGEGGIDLSRRATC